jgi:integrase
LIKDPGASIFLPNANSQPFADVEKGFASALTKTGIKDFRIHDLRPTFGSQLVMQGAELRRCSS